MRGRKPKPTEMKRLAGNPGHRPLNDNEPTPPKPDRAPYAPRFLTAEAQKEWRRLAPVLLDLGLYTEADYAALAMYCQAWGRWVEAERKIDETGGAVLTSKDVGNLYQNPHSATANKAFDQVRKMLAEFGLTPATRARLQIAPREEQDELEKLLFRRNVSVGRE